MCLDVAQQGLVHLLLLLRCLEDTRTKVSWVRVVPGFHHHLPVLTLRHSFIMLSGLHDGLQPLLHAAIVL
jgi:hypothetical protein